MAQRASSLGHIFLDQFQIQDFFEEKIELT